VIGHLLFWLAALTIAYTWLGYPLALAVARRLAARPVTSLRRPPRLSVVIAAYNEAAWIAAKLRSTLTQRYPWDRLEVIVVSDGSTDETDAIVSRYPDRRVRLLRQEPRSGKSLALNRAVAASMGDVIVFTDANALFVPDALRRLAAPFSDPDVGLVSGQGLYTSSPRSDAPVVSNGYVRYEALLRGSEAALGALASADGAIYALRRDHYRDLNGAEVNDFLHPILVALDGGRCRFVPEACTIEPASSGGTQEFRRHVRIIAQGIHIVLDWLPTLVATGCWRNVWMIVSHKVLRWTTAVALAAMLLANIAVLGDSAIYTATLAAQAVFYALAGTGWLAERRGRSIGRWALPYYFCVVSIAGLAGIVRFIRSGADAVWAPAGQAPAAGRAA